MLQSCSVCDQLICENAKHTLWFYDTMFNTIAARLHFMHFNLIKIIDCACPPQLLYPCKKPWTSLLDEGLGEILFLGFSVLVHALPENCCYYYFTKIIASHTPEKQTLT